MTEKQRSKTILRVVGRGALLVLIALGIANLLAYFGIIGGLKDIDIREGFRRLEGFVRSVLPEKREWREVQRMAVMDYPIDLYTLETFGPIGVGAKDMRTTEGQSFLRESIKGRFAADPVSGAFLAVLDEKNYQRLQQGYPPIILYAAEPGQEVDVEIPGANYRLMFVRRREQSDRIAVPSSLGELLLLLFQLSEQQKREAQPVKVSADLYYVLECHCTDFEMEEIQRGFQD